MAKTTKKTEVIQARFTRDEKRALLKKSAQMQRELGKRVTVSSVVWLATMEFVRGK